jgi:hypothetical protein
MDSLDLNQREARARRAYELARALRAALGFAPALLLVAVAVLANQRRASALGFGCSLFVIGSFLLWYGRDVRRAVLPGLALGVLPLCMALCANCSPHLCLGGSCTSLCVPACALGGLGAGIGVALLGGRERHSAGYWLAGSAVALSTGAMGCACIGHAGLVGLASGYVLGLLPIVVGRRQAS